MEVIDLTLSDDDKSNEKEVSLVATAASGPTDVSLELIDPTPDLHSSFVEFDREYFQGKLAAVQVGWSNRMTLCAGICRYEGRNGLCSISLSQKLLQYRPRSDFVNTLLHEMIHAYLFLTERNRDRDDHGPNFLRHMNRINERAGTNITVYHSFHDEVERWRTHWWQCDGPCRSRPPYFGIVKRAMNRAPAPRDPWWDEHRITCGGTFIKIKSPEKKETTKKSSSTSNNKKRKAQISVVDMLRRAWSPSRRQSS